MSDPDLSFLLIPFQNSSTVFPIGVTAPSPVTTTLLFISINLSFPTCPIRFRFASSHFIEGIRPISRERNSHLQASLYELFFLAMQVSLKSHSHSAVYIEHSSGDILRVIGSQESHRVCNILRLAEFPERDLRYSSLFHLI